MDVSAAADFFTDALAAIATVGAMLIAPNAAKRAWGIVIGMIRGR